MRQGPARGMSTRILYATWSGVLVSAGIVALPHLCRLESPHFLTWREMLEAWPELRHHSGAKKAWLLLREDLSRLGFQPVWGHRVGGVSARAVWDTGRLHQGQVVIQVLHC